MKTLTWEQIKDWCCFLCGRLISRLLKKGGYSVNLTAACSPKGNSLVVVPVCGRCISRSADVERRCERKLRRLQAQEPAFTHYRGGK
jgi:hypothetical protein